MSVDEGDTVIGAQLCGILLGFARKKIKLNININKYHHDIILVKCRKSIYWSDMNIGTMSHKQFHHFKMTFASCNM